jgi:von Willebrand factor type A domain
VGGEPALRLTFTIEVDAATDLAVDATRADALITVRARPATGNVPGAQGAEILIMDRSLSMASRAKLGEAKRAICAAIDTLRDGSYLGIIAGNHEAETVHPARGGLARVDTGTKEAAKRQVENTRPGGGTAIGRWLTLAGELFEAAPAGTVRHAVLYTDGKNEHETSEQLGAALASCADRFVCDARGLGDDWNYAELLRITEALHGTAEAVINIPDLTADFARLMAQAQRLAVPRVYLSLRLNDRFRVEFVRQTNPVESDLTNLQQDHGREIHVPLGAWAAGTRQYHLSLRFEHDTLAVGEDLRAARVELRAETPDGAREPCAAAAVVVRRHATPDFKPGKPDDLTRVENARELGMAMRACTDAWENGDTAAADRELRLALERARQLGDDRRLRLLETVAAAGHDGLARLRPGVTRAEMQKIGLDSTKTGSFPDDAPDVLPAGAARSCGHCGHTTYERRLTRCAGCGRPFGDGPGPAP